MANKCNNIKKIIDDCNARTQNDLCKKYKMSKAVLSRLVNKYKTRETVETEDLGEQRKVLLILIVKLSST